MKERSKWLETSERLSSDFLYYIHVTITIIKQKIFNTEHTEKKVNDFRFRLLLKLELQPEKR